MISRKDAKIAKKSFYMIIKMERRFLAKTQRRKGNS